MWLAERAAGSGGMGVRAGIGTVTFGGETPAVLSTAVLSVESLLSEPQPARVPAISAALSMR